MSDGDKERTVNLGCMTWFMLLLVTAALWHIGGTLDRISEHLAMANCLTEATYHVTCPEAKRHK